MADIELVIKIPEEDYQNLKAKDKFDDMYLNYYEKLIVHGTPLPKRHGRLIDADKLIKWCESNDDKLMGEYYINHIVEESTIIDADKREEK